MTELQPASVVNHPLQGRTFILNSIKVFRTPVYAFVGLLILLAPPQVMAWGKSAHIIIARIATERLSPSARQAVAELLGKEETLESVSYWAESMRMVRRETIYWHHVDIPLSRSHYDSGKDCAKGCIIKALDEQIKTLGNRKKSSAERGEALRYVVHLLGDLHQPFHVTINEDQSDDGGNRVKTTSLTGKRTTLHAIWDDDLLNYAMDTPQRSVEMYAAELGQRMKGRSQNTLVSTQGSVTDWAIEAHRLAWGAYNPLSSQGDFMRNDGKFWALTETYYKKNRPVMDTQLLRAGVRLAQILNDIFSTKA